LGGGNGVEWDSRRRSAAGRFEHDGWGVGKLHVDDEIKVQKFGNGRESVHRARIGTQLWPSRFEGVRALPRERERGGNRSRERKRKGKERGKRGGKGRERERGGHGDGDQDEDTNRNRNRNAPELIRICMGPEVGSPGPPSFHRLPCVFASACPPTLTTESKSHST
jgi:hypothetical protein